jgi:D-3-phosphoglycerate dehydrogenase
MKKIYFLEKPISNLQILIDNKSNFHYFHPKKTSISDNNLKTSFALFVKLKNKIDSSLLEKMSSLKYIITPTTGLDHIDRKYCKLKKIKIISLRDIPGVTKHINSTAELTIWFIIESQRSITEASQRVNSGFWDRNKHLGSSLADQTVGIIGLGRIGTKVAEICKLLGANIIYYDSNSKKNNSKFEKKSLNDLFLFSDIISIHISDEPKNENFINNNLLSFIPKNKKIALINTSRGHIVNELDILKALQSKKIGKYYADVLSNEFESNKNWLIDNIIWNNQDKFNNKIFLTPHIGGATFDSIAKAEQAVLQYFFDVCEKNV